MGMVAGGAVNFLKGQIKPLTGYFLPHVIYSIQLIYTKKAYFDLWPDKEQCVSVTSLLLHSECRPRVVGVKEMIDYANPDHYWQMIYFMVPLTSIIGYLIIGDVRHTRKMEALYRAQKKVKKE